MSAVEGAREGQYEPGYVAPAPKKKVAPETSEVPVGAKPGAAGPGPVVPSGPAPAAAPAADPLAGHVTLQPGEQIIGQTQSRGQTVYATNLGNVYAPSGGFLGSYNSPSMASSRNDPNRTFTGIESTANGYRLQGNDGSAYDFYNDGGQLGDGPAAPLGTGSPEYEALLRALDQEGSTAQGNAAADVADTQRTRAFYEPEIARQGTIARRGLQNDAETRGMWGGGSMERALAEQQAAQQVQVGKLGLAEASDVGKIQRGLATTQADIARRKAEAALSAAGTTSLNQGLAPYQTPAV